MLSDSSERPECGWGEEEVLCSAVSHRLCAAAVTCPAWGELCQCAPGGPGEAFSRECNWFSSQAEKVYLKIALLLTNYLWGPGEVTLRQSNQQKSSVVSCSSAELTLSQLRCFAVQISCSPGREGEEVWNSLCSEFLTSSLSPPSCSGEPAHSSSSCQGSQGPRELRVGCKGMCVYQPGKEKMV